MLIRRVKCNTRATKSNEILNAAVIMWPHGINGGGRVTLNYITRSTHVEFYSNTIFISQSWGDHTDISQAVVVYIFAEGFVYLYCWLGNELPEQVGKILQSNQACI